MKVFYQRMAKKAVGRCLPVIAVLVLSIFSFYPAARAEGLMSKLLFFKNHEEPYLRNERAAKDLLREAIDNAVFEVSQVNGFYHRPDLRLDLPEQVKGIEKISKKLNTDLFWHNFQVGINRAAEIAAPKAGVLMKNALNDLKLEKSPEEILNEEGSLTQYFRRKMEDRLLQDFRREIERSVSNQNALQSYVEFKNFYATIPFISNLSILDIEGEISKKALEGIFSKVEEEESRIRLEKA